MTFWVRWGSFAAIAVVPFLRFLVENHYGLLRTDALAAAGMFAASAALLAALLRGRAFLPGLVVCAVIVGADAFRGQLATMTSVPLWAAGALLLALLAGAAALLRERFAAIVMLFSISFFGAEFLKNPMRVSASGGQAKGHTLYLILDAHLGLAGFPMEIPECARARRAVEQTLDAHAFTTYENAASNYSNTLLSIPSILNRKLPSTPDEFTRRHTAGGATVVQPNRLFERFAKNGFDVAVYQHRSIDYAAGSPDVTRRVDYSSEISGLEFVPGWRQRVLWLIGDYQGSSPWLLKARAFLPFRAGFRRTGPLAVRTVWPERLARDIVEAERRTLFFVHLLSPHEPYAYRADGTVLPFTKWGSEGPMGALSHARYAQRYASYCQQVQAMAGQMRWFLGQLDLDRMRVVIHGDHGSRIELAGASEQVNSRNHCSALLAIREPGARAALHNQEASSVMDLLARDFYRDPPLARADSYFWADPQWKLHEGSVTQLWK